MKTIRCNVQEAPVMRRLWRDTLLTPPTPEELAAAGIAGFNPDALGKVWTGISESLAAPDELPAGARTMLGERLMKYGTTQGWKIDASGASISTGDGRRVPMSDGAKQAR